LEVVNHGAPVKILKINKNTKKKPKREKENMYLQSAPVKGNFGFVRILPVAFLRWAGNTCHFPNTPVTTAGFNRSKWGRKEKNEKKLPH
jgi:hypothetical protein